jgi:hypothetical protein
MDIDMTAGDGGAQPGAQKLTASSASGSASPPQQSYAVGFRFVLTMDIFIAPQTTGIASL